MRLRLAYATPAELLAAHDGQWVHGGVLVAGADPTGVALYDPVELVIALPDGAEVTVAGQVVQMVAAGIAVAFDAKQSPPLVAAVSRARGGPAPAPRAPARPLDAHARVAGATTAEKIQLALHGTRDDRALILRDLNRTLHPYVLRNPQIGIDEVLAIARNATVGSELLVAIADKREWIGRADVALALVRNPKTPVPLAIRLLDHVGPGDLRQLAKDARIRTPIQQAARKKVLG